MAWSGGGVLGIGGVVEQGFDGPVVIHKGFGSAQSATLFVVAEIEGDSPQPGGEPGTGAIVFASEIDPGEGFLGEVFTEVGVTGHAGAEAADRIFPPLDQPGEGVLVVAVLDSTHGLFIGQAEPVGDGKREEFGHVGWLAT